MIAAEMKKTSVYLKSTFMRYSVPSLMVNDMLFDFAIASIECDVRVSRNGRALLTKIYAGNHIPGVDKSKQTSGLPAISKASCKMTTY